MWTFVLMVIEEVSSMVSKLLGYVFNAFYFLVGLISFLCGYIEQCIDSVEDPKFVEFREFLENLFRMIFYKRTYNRVGYDDEAVKRGNAYIDKLLEEMFVNKSEYDPYVIEDSVVGFHKKVVFVNVTGEAKLHDGYIKGLSTLHRPTKCSLHDEGNKLKVKADLGAGVLDFHYSGSVKFMNFGPTITVQGTLSYIEVHMEFTVDPDTGRNGNLTKFIIDDMRGMKVWVTGLGPINWAVNPIISAVTKIFKRFVRNFMENKVEKHIRERIPNFQFPVEGGGEDTEAPVTNPPETEVPEETSTSQPETEAPEETSPPEPETVEPKTETPEETSPPEPETEAPEPETEAPEPETEAPEPETEAPEETNPPEPETVEPETEAPKETIPPEEETPETPAEDSDDEVPEEANKHAGSSMRLESSYETDDESSE